MARGEQQELVFRTWRGRRRGAGRKPAGERAGVAHARRPELAGARHPVHVTLRVAPGLASLREERCFAALVAIFERYVPGERGAAAVVHYSVQSNHIHLIVEADDRAALAEVMRAMCIRIARAINRLMGRRGAVFGDRYHARALRTPTETRRALAYVLHNQWHHGGAAVDPRSTASALDERCARARTWLLRDGWRRAPQVVLRR